MFGYLIPSQEYLTDKEIILWNSFNCGICHIYGKHSKLLKLCLNSDLGFLNMWLHYHYQKIPDFKTSFCIGNAGKHCFVLHDEISTNVANIGLILLDTKLKDDLMDNNFKHKFLNKHFKKSIEQAKEKFPNFSQVITTQIEKQNEIEKNLITDLEVASLPSAVILESIIKELTSNNLSKNEQELFFGLGRWVYILDAIADIEEDHKNKNYNPILVNRNFQGNKLQFLNMHKEYILPVIEKTLKTIAENYGKLSDFQKNHIFENVLITTPNNLKSKLFMQIK